MGTIKIKHPIAYTGEGSLHASYGPFNSIEEALNQPSTRYKGLTVGVIVDGSIVEYWWKNGITDSDLIVKSTSASWGTITGTLSNQTDLQTALDSKFDLEDINPICKLGENISKGQAVYVSSANGANMIISKASNSTEATSSKTFGLLSATGVTNDQIRVITNGFFDGLDTSTAGSAGDPVWLGTNGNLIYGLTNKPVAPAHLVFIGIVTRKQSNNGEIFIKIQNGFELKEIHDVLLSSPATNDFLYYASDGLWKNKQLSKSDVGLGNVPNTDATNPANITQSASYRFVSDTEKSTWNGKQDSLGFTPENVANKQTDLTASATKYPTVNAVNTGLATKENTITAGTTSQYYRGDKTFQTLDKTAVGLGNVDNIADASKTFAASQITSGTFANARIPQVSRPNIRITTAVSSGNSTSEQVITSITIPANSLAVGDIIRLGAFFSFASNTATKTPRVRFGLNTTTGTILFGPATVAASVTCQTIELMGIVTSTTNLRMANASTISGLGQGTGTTINFTIDITTSTSFSFNVQKGAGTDTAILEFAWVEILTS